MGRMGGGYLGEGGGGAVDFGVLGKSLDFEA